LDFFILGDADRVRERIERHLLAGSFDALEELSRTLTVAIGALAQRIRDAYSAQIIMAGGDDVLLRLSKDRFSKADLEAIARQFASECGCTISFGVGADVTTAYVNLRRAKSNGGNAIVGSEAIR
jgi:hypothetical protein